MTPEELIGDNLKLISLPAIVAKINQLLNDPNSSAADIAHLIGQDPVLTARLLKLVNSPFYNFPSEKFVFLCAFSFFTVAAISDGLDGLFARYFNQFSVLGAYLDPIADKLLLTSGFVYLAVIKIIPSWLTVILLSRDILIVIGIALFTIAGIHIKMNPTLVSKFTTFVQVLTIFLSLLNPQIPDANAIKCSLFYITAGFTIASGLHYIYLGLNIFQDASGNSKIE